MVSAGKLAAQYRLHPFHALLIASAFPLFLGAMLSDWAYSGSYQVQWLNFSSWLIAGGLVFAGFALLWSLIAWLRAGRGGGAPLTTFLLLLGAWLLGFVNALVHAKDAWASMPAGLILSVLVTILILAAVIVSFSTLRVGGAK